MKKAPARIDPAPVQEAAGLAQPGARDESLAISEYERPVPVSRTCW